jgi:Dyp-type peroxidase family
MLNVQDIYKLLEKIFTYIFRRVASMPDPTTNLAKIQDNLAKIQGNIIGGFNKDYQTFLFLKFNDPDKGRKWVGQIATEIATSEEVKAFNDLFKAVKHRSGREGVVKATWTNIAFTHSGLKTLGISQVDLDSFPDDFKDGLAARSEWVGDVGSSAPENWVGPLGSKDVHALLIVASDSLADLNNLVDGYINDPTFSAAATVIFRQEGRTRVDDPGHEHFGFKDGVSQPGIRDVTEPLDSDPNKGKGHEDLLHPGEFVLGYPKQKSEPKHVPGGDDVNPNPDPGDISISGPAWTKNGSYLVFRRLSQNVQAFRNTVHELAKITGLDSAVLGAKLVGRYKSGAPLEQTDKQKEKCIDPALRDPSIDDPGLLSDDRINHFEYGDDLQGQFVPRAAHVRKAYPRDQEGGAGASSESETQTHRLLRRGIPFGNSLGAPEHGGAYEEFPHDRGLLFLAYQKSIKDQFEFVQSAWVNDPNFPCNSASKDKDTFCNADKPDGQDPIIAQSDEGSFRLPPNKGSGCPVHQLNVQHFVTTTGGEYFFQPSIEALHQIAGATPQ